MNGGREGDGEREGDDVGLREVRGTEKREQVSVKEKLSVGGGSGGLLMSSSFLFVRISVREKADVIEKSQEEF